MHRVWDLISFLSAGRVSTRLRPPRKTLYITFDDGPHEGTTAELSSLLKSYGARATFFLVGAKVDSQKDVVRALVDSGHVLGNHSYSHRKLTMLSVKEMRNDQSQADAAIGAVDGNEQHLFRPPWGKIGAAQLLSCVAAGSRIALWSRDSFDYKDSAEQIVQTFRKQPPVNGDVLLFHDDGAAAQQALRQLLPEWRAAGFELEALPQ